MKEMGYKQYDFEQKILTPVMREFYQHLIKLKMCDKEFSGIFHKDLYQHAIHFKSYWEEDALSKGMTIFKKLQTKTISKPGNMEKAYLSVLENMDTEMQLQSNGLYDAIENATSDFKYQQETLKQVKRWMRNIQLEDLPWFVNVTSFMETLKPRRNEMENLDPIREKLKEFISNFLN